MTHPAPPHTPVVFRQLAIPVPVFDRIKDMQRRYVLRTGQHMPLMETIATIISEHQQYEELEEHDRTSKQPALLRSR